MAASESQVAMDGCILQKAEEVEHHAVSAGRMECRWFEAIKRGDIAQVRFMIENQLCEAKEDHFDDGSCKIAKHPTMATLTSSDPFHLEDAELQELVGNPVFEYDGVQLSLLCLLNCKNQAELIVRKQLLLELVKAKKSSNSRTRTLHLAALVGDEQIIKETLTKGANRSVLNSKGKTPLDFVQKESLRNIFQANFVYTPPISPMLSLPELSFEEDKLGLGTLISSTRDAKLLDENGGNFREDEMSATKNGMDTETSIPRFPLKFPGKLLLKSKKFIYQKVRKFSWQPGSKLASLLSEKNNQPYLSIRCGSQVLQSNLIDAGNLTDCCLELNEEVCILLEKPESLISIELRAAYKTEASGSNGLKLFAKAGSSKNVLAVIDILLNKEWLLQCRDQVRHFDAKWKQNSGFSFTQKPASSGKLFSKSGFFTRFSASTLSLAKKSSQAYLGNPNSASSILGTLSLSALYFSMEEEQAYQVLPDSVDDYGRWKSERSNFYKLWFDGVLSIKTGIQGWAAESHQENGAIKYKSEGMLIDNASAYSNWKRRHLKWTGYIMTLTKEDGDTILGNLDLRSCIKYENSVQNDLLSVNSVLLVMEGGEEIELKCSSKTQFRCLNEGIEALMACRPKYWK